MGRWSPGPTPLRSAWQLGRVGGTGGPLPWSSSGCFHTHAHMGGTPRLSESPKQQPKTHTIPHRSMRSGGGGFEWDMEGEWSMITFHCTHVWNSQRIKQMIIKNMRHKDMIKSSKPRNQQERTPTEDINAALWEHWQPWVSNRNVKAIVSIP